MKNHWLYILLVLCIVFLHQSLFAQNKDWKSGLSVGAKIGINGPFGDFNFFDSEENYIKPNTSVFAAKKWNHWLENRLELNYGLLGGTKLYPRAGKDPVMAWFDAKVYGFNMQFKWNIIQTFALDESRPFHVYGILGAGLSFYDTQRIRPYTMGDDVTNVINTNNGTGSMLVFPTGIGVDYRLNDKFSVMAEGVYQIPNSDLPDLTVGGSQYDIYFNASAGIAYNLGTSVSHDLLDYQKTEGLLSYGVPKPVKKKEETEDVVVEEELVVEEFVPFRVIGPDIIDGKDKFNLVFELEFEEKMINGNIRIHHPDQIEIANPALPYANYTRGDFITNLKINLLYVAGMVNFIVSSTAEPVLFTRPISDFVIFADLTTDKDETFVSHHLNYVYLPDKGYYKLMQKQVVDSSLIVEDVAVSGNGYETVDYENANPEDIAFYSVQVMAQRRPLISVAKAEQMFGLNNIIEERFADGWIRYRSGHFKDLDDALKYRNKLRANNKVKGAFVVAFVKGQRNDDPSLNEGKVAIKAKTDDGYLFRIQIHSSPEAIAAQDLTDAYSLTIPVYEEKADGAYRYLAGNYKNYNQAQKARDNLISLNDVDGAFVVAYYKGQRLNKIPSHLTKQPSKKNVKKPAKKPESKKAQNIPDEKKIKEAKEPSGSDTSFVKTGKENASGNAEYRILFKKSALPIAESELKSYFQTPEKITSELYGGYYYYYVGNFKNIDVAIGYLEYLAEKLHLKDGKLVRFENGERVSPLN